MIEDTLDIERILADVLETIWKRVETDRISEFYTEDAVISGVIPDYDVSRADLANMLDHLMMLVTIEAFDVQTLVQDSEARCAAQVVFHMRHRMSERRARMSAGLFAEIRDGRIARSHVVMDALSMLEQFQLVPDGTLLLCLPGNELK